MVSVAGAIVRASDALAELPARSVAVSVTAKAPVWVEAPVIAPDAGAIARPAGKPVATNAIASGAVTVNVKALRYMPLAVAALVNVGAVVSMVTLKAAVGTLTLPAVSVAVAVNAWTPS